MILVQRRLIASCELIVIVLVLPTVHVSRAERGRHVCVDYQSHRAVHSAVCEAGCVIMCVDGYGVVASCCIHVFVARNTGDKPARL